MLIAQILGKARERFISVTSHYLPVTLSRSLPEVEHYVGDVAGGTRRLRPRGALRHRPPEGAQQTGEPPSITLSLIVTNYQLRLLR